MAEEHETKRRRIDLVQINDAGDKFICMQDFSNSDMVVHLESQVDTTSAPKLLSQKSCKEKRHETIKNASDLANVLRSLSFWEKAKLPRSVLEFCDQHNTSEWSDVDLNGDEIAANIMCVLSTIFPNQRKGGDDGALSRAIKLCRVEILEYMAEKMGPLFRIYDTTTFAFKGSLECLRFFHQMKGRWDCSTCAAAARGGHLECLRYLHENGCAWNNNVIVLAAENGHIDCWKYAREHGVRVYNSLVCVRIAARGNLQNLKYAVEVCGYKVDKDVVYEAVRANHVDCVRYAIDKYGSLSDGFDELKELKVIVCIMSYSKGTVEDQDWLRSTLTRTGHWNARLYSTIETLDYFTWLYDQMCPWDETTTNITLYNRSDDMLRFMMDRFCPYSDNFLHNVVSFGINKLSLLRYLIEDMGLYMDADGSLFDRALELHFPTHMPCVQYLLDVGCPHTAEAYNRYLTLLDP